MPDFPALAAGLRRWAAAQDDRVRAAVEFLIWHESWLRRPDFYRAAVGKQGDSYYLRWDRALSFAETAKGAASSMNAVLRYAAWVAQDPFGLNGFGKAHRQAAIDTLAAALDVKPSAVAGDL